MIASGVRVEGLKELRRGLNRIDPQLTKELRSALLNIGKDVAADAQSRVPSRSGKARGSIRAGASGNSAYVAGGKKTVPYYGWLDFGSRIPQRGRPRTVGPWKGTGSGPSRGRFIYPAIDKNRKNIVRGAVAAFDKAKKDALTRGPS